MKITLAILLALVLLSIASPALAFGGEIEWGKLARREKPAQSFYGFQDGFVLMQDLRQCEIVNGKTYCADVCGGISRPYTICSYE